MILLLIPLLPVDLLVCIEKEGDVISFFGFFWLKFKKFGNKVYLFITNLNTNKSLIIVNIFKNKNKNLILF